MGPKRVREDVDSDMRLCRAHKSKLCPCTGDEQRQRFGFTDMELRTQRAGDVWYRVTSDAEDLQVKG